MHLQNALSLPKANKQTPKMAVDPEMLSIVTSPAKLSQTPPKTNRRQASNQPAQHSIKLRNNKSTVPLHCLNGGIIRVSAAKTTARRTISTLEFSAPSLKESAGKSVCIFNHTCFGTVHVIKSSLPAEESMRESSSLVDPVCSNSLEA